MSSSRDVRKGLEQAAKWHEDQARTLHNIRDEAKGRDSIGHANMAATMASWHTSAASSIRAIAEAEKERWIDRRIDQENMDAAYEAADADE